MNQALKTFSEQLALDLKAKLAAPEMAEFVAKMKSAGADRSFEVVMSTADEDRQGDELDQSQWDLKFFDLNPVVLWAHNYGGFPIGLVEDITIEGNKAIATGHFAPEGLNPEADTACGLYQAKVLKAVSPGYIQNDDGTRELLEVSFCAVPAGRFAVSLRDISKLGLSKRELVTKGFLFETRGAVPYADHGKADPDTAWDGATEVKACGDDLDKLKAICAWFDSENADTKGGYKLPHHEADSLKAVWKGVAAAMGALKGSRGGLDIPAGDKEAVYNHLAKHYEEFGKTPPDYEKAIKAEELGDECQQDDGTPGVLANDLNNPGEMICIPREGKAITKSMNELDKKLKTENDRHADGVTKAIDEFKGIEEFDKAVDGEQADHFEKCMKAIDDTYPLEDQANGKAMKFKAIDEFKADMTAEHTTHVKTIDKAIDEFKATMNGDEDDKAIEQFKTKADDELARHAKAHEEMCKAEGEDDEEKSVSLFLDKALADTTFKCNGVDVDPIILRQWAKGLVSKYGAAVSAANKAKLDAVIKALEDHDAEHGKSTSTAIAALKELSSPQDDEGEEQKPDEKSVPAPKPRSSTSGASPREKKALEELEAHLLTQRLLRQVKTSVDNGLRQTNDKIRAIRTNGS